jgi:hypothetical protein
MYDTYVAMQHENFPVHFFESLFSFVFVHSGV